MSDEPNVVAGKVGPHKESHEPRLLATNFVAETPVGGFHLWDGTQHIGQHWQMLHNDQFGDCGPAATSHNNMAKAQNPHIGHDLGRPKFNGVLGCYFAYGIAMGEPGPQPDQGIDNKTWLGWLYEQGIIYGYGEVPLFYLDWFAQVARGAIVGLIIDGNTAINDFNSQPKVPWSQMPNAQDGHDVLLIKTGGDGSGGFVTWGGVQPFDQSFRGQITDAWIIYDKDDPKVDHAALQAALQDVHGVVTSTPTETPAGGFFAHLERLVEEEFAHLSVA